MHDAYRLNRGGRGTHAMVVRGWEALARAGVETNILCTVNAANEEHGTQVYRYFRDELGARYLQFIPIVERVRAADLAQAERGWRSGTSALLYRQDGDCVTSRSTSPASYGRFLCEVFDQWLASDVGEVFIQDVDSTLSAMFGSASVCVHAPVCGANMAMEFNGDVYACDHWVEPDWLVGSITSSSLSQLAASDKMRDFARLKPDLDEECRACAYLRLCWGGCPKDRFVRRGERTHNYLCEGYRAFYEHATPPCAPSACSSRRAGRPATSWTPRSRPPWGSVLPRLHPGRGSDDPSRPPHRRARRRRRRLTQRGRWHCLRPHSRLHPRPRPAPGHGLVSHHRGRINAGGHARMSGARPGTRTARRRPTHPGLVPLPRSAPPSTPRGRSWPRECSSPEPPGARSSSQY